MKLNFDPIEHAYTLDEMALPSVTQCLQPLINLSGIPKDVLETARARGESVHKATELFDMGLLATSSISELLRPYIEAWMKFREEKQFTPELIEHRVWHNKYRYAGTVDRIGRLSSGVKILIDIKSTHEPPSYAGPQTAAYLGAFNYGKPDSNKAVGIYTVHLKKTGDYEFIEHDVDSDFPVFMSCLKIHNWKLSKKKRK